LKATNVASLVYRTGRGRPEGNPRLRIRVQTSRRRGDLWHRDEVAPIVVHGCLWGAAIVGTSQPEPLPPDAEGACRGFFADLVRWCDRQTLRRRAELNASRARIVAAADQAPTPV